MAQPLTANDILTASLQVSGNVPGITQIYVENVTGNTNFNLTQQVAPTQIATIRERSNKKTGYKVMVTSANLDAGNCPTTTTGCFYSPANNEALSLVVYKGTSTTALTMQALPASNTANWTNSLTKTTGSGVSNALNVSFDGSTAGLSAGADYSETLTFTIASNL